MNVLPQYPGLPTNYPASRGQGVPPPPPPMAPYAYFGGAVPMAYAAPPFAYQPTYVMVVPQGSLPPFQQGRGVNKKDRHRTGKPQHKRGQQQNSKPPADVDFNTICRHHLEGKCNRRYCRFLHPSQQELVTLRADKVSCPESSHCDAPPTIADDAEMIDLEQLVRDLDFEGKPTL